MGLRPCKETMRPHLDEQLIVVSVNRTTLAQFGTHPDTEDFLLLGDPDAKPLYLVFAYDQREVFEGKVRNKTLCPNDFIALQVRYNDPEVSFFSVPGGVIHGEAVAKHPGRPATFYVTESRDLPLDVIELGDIQLAIA